MVSLLIENDDETVMKQDVAHGNKRQRRRVLLMGMHRAGRRVLKDDQSSGTRNSVCADAT